jgi:hypothetical protein
LLHKKPPNTFAKNCNATISSISPPNAIVGKIKESTADPAMFDPLTLTECL